MGFFKKLLGAPSSPAAPAAGPGLTVKVSVFGGDEPLEVVGVEDSQDALWEVAGVPKGSPVGLETYGILLPEANDPVAISVRVGGGPVGFLSREDAEQLRPGLTVLIRKLGNAVALTARVSGCEPGTLVIGGIGNLSVTLFHDPADFGLQPMTRSGASWEAGFARSAAHRRAPNAGMPWADGMPTDPEGRVPYLRSLLERGKSDLVDRHFMFNFLEEALYRLRDSSPSALGEFDAVYERHHFELGAGMRRALLADFRRMPRIPCYHQAAIRWAKAHDWEKALLWAERGIGMYGSQPGHDESVQDLVKRVGTYRAKSAGPPPRGDPKVTPGPLPG